jgi:hypothetical protein
LRAGALQESGVTAFPFFLESFPWTLAEVFIPQRPKKRGHKDDHADDIMRRKGFGYDRIVFGDGLLGHQFLLETCGQSRKLQNRAKLDRSILRSYALRPGTPCI